MIKELISSNFRKKDSVKIKITSGESHINCSTGQILQELPSGAVVSQWATITTAVRKDQTGDILEIAHDVEDTQNTYTEMYLMPDSYCDITFGSIGSNVEGYSYFNTNVYPTYKATEIYAKDDIVVYEGMEWISEFDDNVGNQPNRLYGWDLYLPYIERRELHYGTYEEVYGSASTDEAGN